MEVDVNFNKVKRPRKRHRIIRRIVNVKPIPKTTYWYLHTLSCGHDVASNKQYKKNLGCRTCGIAVNKLTESLNI